MKYAGTWLMLLIVPLFMNCAVDRRPMWFPALEEGTVYSLNKTIAEAKNHLELALRLQMTDTPVRAEQEMTLALQNIEQLESHFFPLLNSRGHLTAAFRLSRRDELFKAKEEMVKVRAHLARAAANTFAENVEEIEQISAEIFNLQQTLIKANKSTDEKFNQIAVRINKLLIPKTQPII